MDRLELQRLRDLPIEGVAERLGLRVNRHKSLCPFHDDHSPSLSYNERRNTFRCFVCGAHGGTIDLVMRHLGVGFKEAIGWLGGPSLSLPYWEGTATPMTQTNTPHGSLPLLGGAGGGLRFDPKRYERFFERPWLSEEARKFLFEERMLDERVVRWCRLTSWRDKQGVNWLQIPYYDVEGQLIGIQNRNLGREGPRFRFPQGSRCSIYNLPVLKMLHEGDELYITEGASDCWAMLSSGHKAIAIPSATLLSPKDKEVLSSLSSSLMLRWHMYPDKDAPGERLFMQLKELLPSLEHHQLPVGCKDYSELYVQRVSQQRRQP